MKNFFILSLGLLAILLTGCSNTVQGFGKDMQHTGQDIQNSVKPHPAASSQ